MTAAVDRIPRCTHAHDSWVELSEHLAAAFPELPAGDVFRELSSARDGIQSFGLSETETLDMVDLIARYQLLLRTGQVVDAARLDPEQHVSRRLAV